MNSWTTCWLQKRFCYQTYVHNFHCYCFAHYDVLIVLKMWGLEVLLAWQSYRKFLNNSAGSCSVFDTVYPYGKTTFCSENLLPSFYKHTSETAKQRIFVVLELMFHPFFSHLKSDAGLLIREKLIPKEKLQKICLNRQSLIRRRPLDAALTLTPSERLARPSKPLWSSHPLKMWQSRRLRIDVAAIVFFIAITLLVLSLCLHKTCLGWVGQNQCFIKGEKNEAQITGLYWCSIVFGLSHFRKYGWFNDRKHECFP